MVYTFITIVVVIASILLIGVVLIQNSKGGGLASSFQSQNQIMGVKKTTETIEKATWILVSVVVVLSIASAAFYPRQQENYDSQLKDMYQNEAPASTTDGLQEQYKPRLKHIKREQIFLFPFLLISLSSPDIALYNKVAKEGRG